MIEHLNKGNTPKKELEGEKEKSIFSSIAQGIKKVIVANAAVSGSNQFIQIRKQSLKDLLIAGTASSQSTDGGTAFPSDLIGWQIRFIRHSAAGITPVKYTFSFEEVLSGVSSLNDSRIEVDGEHLKTVGLDPATQEFVLTDTDGFQQDVFDAFTSYSLASDFNTYLLSSSNESKEEFLHLTKSDFNLLAADAWFYFSPYMMSFGNSIDVNQQDQHYFSMKIQVDNDVLFEPTLDEDGNMTGQPQIVNNYSHSEQALFILTVPCPPVWRPAWMSGGMI